MPRMDVAFKAMNRLAQLDTPGVREFHGRNVSIVRSLGAASVFTTRLPSLTPISEKTPRTVPTHPLAATEWGLPPPSPPPAVTGSVPLTFRAPDRRSSRNWEQRRPSWPSTPCDARAPNHLRRPAIAEPREERKGLPGTLERRGVSSVETMPSADGRRYTGTSDQQGEAPAFADESQERPAVVRRTSFGSPSRRAADQEHTQTR